MIRTVLWREIIGKSSFTKHEAYLCVYKILTKILSEWWGNITLVSLHTKHPSSFSNVFNRCDNITASTLASFRNIKAVHLFRIFRSTISKYIRIDLGDYAIFSLIFISYSLYFWILSVYIIISTAYPLKTSCSTF